MVLAGHGRLATALELKLDQVPCVEIGSMSSEQKRAYALADNKLTLNAGWDEELLALELKELLAAGEGFDLGLTGFTIAEADGLIEGLSVEEPASPKDERLPPLEDGPAISQKGDVWRLGKHRLICGDSLDSVCRICRRSVFQGQMLSYRFEREEGFIAVQKDFG